MVHANFPGETKCTRTHKNFQDSFLKNSATTHMIFQEEKIPSKKYYENRSNFPREVTKIFARTDVSRRPYPQEQIFSKIASSDTFNPTNSVKCALNEKAPFLFNFCLIHQPIEKFCFFVFAFWRRLQRSGAYALIKWLEDH